MDKAKAALTKGAANAIEAWVSQEMEKAQEHVHERRGTAKIEECHGAIRRIHELESWVKTLDLPKEISSEPILNKIQDKRGELTKIIETQADKGKEDEKKLAQKCVQELQVEAEEEEKAAQTMIKRITSRAEATRSGFMKLKTASSANLHLMKQYSQIRMRETRDELELDDDTDGENNIGKSNVMQETKANTLLNKRESRMSLVPEQEVLLRALKNAINEGSPGDVVKLFEMSKNLNGAENIPQDIYDTASQISSRFKSIKKVPGKSQEEVMCEIYRDLVIDAHDAGELKKAENYQKLYTRVRQCINGSNRATAGRRRRHDQANTWTQRTLPLPLDEGLSPAFGRQYDDFSSDSDDEPEYDIRPDDRHPHVHRHRHDKGCPEAACVLQ